MPSTDEQVTKDLIETLEDGREGFTKGADKLAETDRPEFAATFRELAAQRGRFTTELRDLAAKYGDKIDEDGSMLGALHRGWMTIKDAIAGDDPEGVLDAAEQGEDHAKQEYADALKSDISPHLRTVVERQAREIQTSHDTVKAMRNSVS